MSRDDTIFALSTAPGKAGIAVIRVSGSSAISALSQFVDQASEPRYAALRVLRDPQSGDVIDEALVLRFEAGASFTGEDLVEIQCHGSQAVVRLLLERLEAIAGLRMAEAGEFTRRALLSGRMDLSQIEGLGDLIEAETESQRRQAVRALRGDLGRKVEAWRTDLVRAAALIEATMDFADEDVPEDVSGEVLDLIDRTIIGMDHEIAGFSAAERVRDGFEVAIIGPPNAGKSTLLNALSGREAAITSDVAGTTRDVIEVQMDIGGIAVTILDTAGLREAKDSVEEIGIARARDRAHTADLRVFLKDQDDSIDTLGVERMRDDIVVSGKADIHDSEGVSGLTGQGIGVLLKRIQSVLERRASAAGSLVRLRHQTSVVSTVSILRSARSKVESDPDSLELVAETLRQALRSIDVLIGRVGVEDILDVVFLNFCLGK